MLSPALHGAWRLLEGDAAFAADTSHVPIVVAELPASSRDYPVVFAAGSAMPVAILGLARTNLFVSNGMWDAAAYIPAYVRRYPFGFIATQNPEGFALAIDQASARVERGGEQGKALFENGQPSELTRQAMQFCKAFQGDARATRQFAEALKSAELLVERRANATLPDGRKLGLEGFQIVDAQKFAHLDAGRIVEWHIKGWLALVHFHLASLDRFSGLLTRQGRQAPDQAAPAPTTTH